MKQFLIVAPLMIGLLILNGQAIKAQTSECYPLTSAEATAILSDQEHKIKSDPFDWKVANVEQNFTCMDFCMPDEIIVSSGRFNAGTCTYTLTNESIADIVGQTSTIVLKQVPKGL